jgi:hypothetical protein
LVDLLTLVVGAAVGAGVGLVMSYLVFFAKPRQPKVQVVQRAPSGEVGVRTISLEELDRSKRELRTITLERDLLSSALTRIYEAETEGRITREEREMIAKRYSEQIREIESKLRDRELLVEVGELEGLRNELVTLFREKIQNIEARLDQTRERIQPAKLEPIKSEAARKASPKVDELESVIERRAPKKEETEGEKRVKELREEVMEALAKLEQIDTKKENEKV